MKRYFKLFIAALLAVTMALFVAACDGTDEKGEKNATDVSGKTYVYVDGKISGTDQVTDEDMNKLYKDTKITFNADGTVDSEMFPNSTWKQSGADVTLTVSMAGMSMDYNCKATGNTLTVSASSMGMTMTLNYKLETPDGGDEEGGDEEGGDEEGGQDEQTGVSGKAYVFEDVTLVSNTGNYPASMVEEIIAASKEGNKGAHFVFEKGGRFLVVVDGEAMAGTWTQNGTTVTAVIEGEAQDFTLDGNKIFAEMSDEGLTLKLTLTYDKDFKYDGEISGGDKEEGGSGVVTGRGRAYSFKNITITQNTSGMSNAELISALEQNLKDSHFIFNDGGEFIAVQQGMAVKGTWNSKGNTLTAYMGGEPQEFTYDGDDIYAVVDSGDGVVLKITYSYDKNYSYSGPITDIGGGNNPAMPEISGKYRLIDLKVDGDVENFEQITAALCAKYENTVMNFISSEDGYGSGEYVGGEHDGEMFKFYIELGGNGKVSVYVNGLAFSYDDGILYSEEIHSDEYNVSYYIIYGRA
ncbi:MAG: hypothetical protein K2G38_05470 [Clostridia bacterium]|nr:hypothetical protein [Clostridia bacterium]